MTTGRQVPGRASREGIRCFLALLFPEALIERAAAVQSDLRARCPGAPVRWVAPDLFHLTVRFFGALGPEEVGRVRGWMGGLELPRFRVRMERVSAFPGESRPSVIWIGLTDESGRLAAEVAALDRALEALGFGPPDRPWKSHLTLGRVPRDRRLRLEPAELGRCVLPAESFVLDELALVRSDLRPTGPVYTPIETVRARL